MPRIAIVDNEKLKDMSLKKHILGVCPVNRMGQECIKIEEDNKLTIDEGLCTGCGICVKPAQEAIKIINLPEEWKKEPIHRYGQNLFALYSLPTPTFENVVGILGVNGIGKSTAIKILAQVTKPNLGDYEKEGSFKSLIEKFKGTEAQGFFENVRDKKIKVSYKPQQVEIIPKTTKGKVKDLLKKIDENNKLDEIADILEIKEILDNNINKISGGELQRVAIAATVLKKADLYIFDEPTSFLDIKQRINLSKFIKSLADENTAILIVEHDLIIFDYLTNSTHIMYGKEDAYGVVSGIKPTKNGINTYLSGFLKEENIRFRDKKIKFESKEPLKAHTKDILISWEGIEKTLDKFNLKAEKGQIHKGDVIGILGENGIGKTTFVKILANALKQDKGKIDKKIKVSYKPQYLEASDDLVSVVLKDAISKYANQIINPLNIKPLLLKKLDELSGGELQRVAIALCLSKDADLYLLDEPSAYLDTEQRLLISRLIRDFVEHKGASALVVDHDLLFIDYLSHKLMVFTGKPAKHGIINGPFAMEEGMNMFLKELNVTLRRDELSNMPRINKEDSVKDRQQKERGKFYYS
jgi:ATP-binding cassette subfamily E protein 1